MSGAESVERHQMYFRVPEKLMERIEEIVYEKGGPDTDITNSDVVREAMRDYFQKYEESLRVCEPMERGKPAGGKRCGVTVVQPEYDYLKEIAYEGSAPGETVSVSDVLRSALRDYVEKYDGDVREVEPDRRGGLESSVRTH